MTLSQDVTFLTNFDWTDSMLQPAELARIEDLLVEFHEIFARNRFDIGMNEDFKVQGQIDIER